MARVNLIANRATFGVILTHEGAPAWQVDAERQLRRSVLACLLWEDTFYELGRESAERIADLADRLAPEVVASLAVEAREQQQLRHAPLWLVRALARKGGRIVGDTLARVIQRADELTEFVALYWKDERRPLSAQVKRGLAGAFT
jgi:60 kDa SS-A/Ro ribonucleoprotein